MDGYSYKYYESDNLDLYVETSGEGHKFLHLTLHKWSPSVLKELRDVLAFARFEFYYRGHEYVFAVTDDMKVVKFWNTIHPLNIIDELSTSPKIILGGWETIGV